MPLGGCSPGWHHKKFASQQMKMNLWCAHIKQNFLITVSSMNWFSSSVLTRERLGKRGTRTCPVLNFLFLRGENWFLSLGAPFMTPVSCIMDLSLQVDCYRKKTRAVQSGLVAGSPQTTILCFYLLFSYQRYISFVPEYLFL